ncbi:MAG TPA: 4-hydroxy-tetrahydrodipicolinate synthase [Clostridiales bacterium]|jgi:4-hydroxy-tetrahydrodipicolinate synthase|nr:4-hydroxy-tetrahydrodipicolinate synthase [Clostridiales bacterium]
MQKTRVFTGAGVAVVTPFKDNALDYESLGRIIDWQIENKTDAIIVAGTTGEGSTLTDEEHKEIIRFSVEHVAGRVPVVAGTGSNDTDYAISLSKYACEVGADALLLVSPYYNKATPAGLIKNFSAIEAATDKPIILYNVPSRTGCNITLPVYKELAKHDRIVAVKEASGNISQIAEIAAECGDSLDIYSGNDDHIVPVLSLGGIGVISVLSNIMPRETHDIVELWHTGRVKESAIIQLKLMDIINALFCEVNPIPVKAAMAEMGWCSNEIRLPLTEIEPEHKEKLLKAMKRHGLVD